MSLFDKLTGAGEGGRSGSGRSRDGDSSARRGAAAAGYDRVHVPMPGGEIKQLTREQFEAMALEDRIRLLVQGTLKFFRGDEEISSVEALKSAY